MEAARMEDAQATPQGEICYDFSEDELNALAEAEDALTKSDNEPYMLVNDWQRYINSWAVRKGWWDPDKVDSAPKIAGRNTIELAALVGTEASEAVEAARMGWMETFIDEHGKPQGYFSELADAVIRIMDVFNMADQSLEREIELKMAYNEKRPVRHGGKLA